MDAITKRLELNRSGELLLSVNLERGARNYRPSADPVPAGLQQPREAAGAPFAPLLHVMYEAKQANGDQIDGNDIIQQAGHEEDKNPRNQGNGRAQHDNV